MSTAQAGAGGSNSQAGGDAGESNDQKNVVAYETHQKLLSEKKKRDAELEETRKQLGEATKREKEREEADLKAKEDYKTLLANREKELADERQKRQAVEEQVADTRKLSAFLESVTGKVDKQYWGLIPLDKIVLDPATGAPDPAVLQTVVRDFEKSFALVIQPKGGAKGLPHEAAKGGSEKLTVSQWKALKTSKEMKEKYGAVDWTTE